jgi:hypothetical protein
MRDKSPYKSNPSALENIINNNYKNEIKNRKIEKDNEEDNQDSEEVGELECETQKISNFNNENEKNLIDFFKDLKNLKAFEEFMENRNLLNLDEIEENRNHADKMIDKISELHEENQRLKWEIEVNGHLKKELKKDKNKVNYDDPEQANQSEDIQSLKKEIENKEKELEDLSVKVYEPIILV